MQSWKRPLESLGDFPSETLNLICCRGISTVDASCGVVDNNSGVVGRVSGVVDRVSGVVGRESGVVGTMPE